LIYKLKRYGISGNLINWLKNYLTNRKQRVVVNGVTSDWTTLWSGVPQGSVLGPLLFLTFINDIVDTLEYSKPRLFADDTCLTINGKNKEIMVRDMNADLINIENWANTWLVDFSPAKTKAMLISNKTNRNQKLEIKFYGKNIETVLSHKHLGMTFSSDLSWNEHIEKVINSCSKYLNILKFLKYKADRKTLDCIYTSFIRSKLEYGSVLFAGAPNNLLNKLDRLELEAIRIITGATRNTSRAKIYIEYGKASLTKRRKLNVLTLFYQIHHGTTANYLIEILNSFKHTRTYNFRAALSYKNPFCKLSVYARSFFPVAIKLWNSLPFETRELPTIRSFKNELNPKNFRMPLYYYGKRWPGVHHARMRMGCSALNYDLHYNLHVRDDKSCACGWFRENYIHYVSYCPRYINE
jgi:hypothetical protein